MLREVSVVAQNRRIYGRAAGKAGDPLILGIHGWSQRNGWHTWKPLLEPLAEAGYLALSVDMPGWGQSAPWNDGPMTRDEGIAAVLSVGDHFGKSSAILMGKSWGGAVAIETALTNPHRVSKLILTAPAYSNLARLSALSQPVLLAWAEDDPVIPVEYAARFAQAAPEVQLVIYATGGHSAAPNNAADFAIRAVEFLGDP